MSPETGKGICFYCVRKAEQASGMEPVGAIKCPSCGNYDGVDVRYTDGLVRWLFAGVTDDGIAYRIAKTHGHWHFGSKPISAKCVRCEGIIPVDSVYLSPYVRPTRPGK